MPSCGLWLTEDGVGKVVPQSVRLVADIPDVQKLLDVHNRTHHPMQFLDPARKAMSIFSVRVTAHTPCMQLRQEYSERARTKLCPSFAFVFHLGISFFRGFGKGVMEPRRPPNPPSTGEGLRHPWLLSTIATATATWLGALSRSNGRQAHRRGVCYRVGEVLRKSTRGNYGERVSRTTQKTAHRTSHCAHACRTSPSTEQQRTEQGLRRSTVTSGNKSVFSPLHGPQSTRVSARFPSGPAGWGWLKQRARSPPSHGLGVL